MPIIIKPPNYIVYKKLPTIFLAGPIQGVNNWRTKAIKFFMDTGIKNLYIASPRRDVIKGDFITAMFNEQVDWESYYLKKAATVGCILFWLAKETVHDCTRAYAQTTRFELAEWITKSCYNDKIHLTIGIEDGFSGARYIKRRLEQDCRNLIIHNSLLKTCQSALLVIKEKYE